MLNKLNRLKKTSLRKLTKDVILLAKTYIKIELQKEPGKRDPDIMKAMGLEAKNNRL